MALKATVYKLDLNVADVDRHYYADHALTLARHPSETEERMMLRVVAFLLRADPALSFCRGLSTDDEPDLWQLDLTGAIRLWIDLGQPDERRIAKACGRADQVLVVAYGGKSAGIWWQQIAPRLARFTNLTVICIAPEPARALAGMARRAMRLQATIQDGRTLVSDENATVEIEPEVLYDPERC